MPEKVADNESVKASLTSVRAHSMAEVVEANALQRGSGSDPAPQLIDLLVRHGLAGYFMDPHGPVRQPPWKGREQSDGRGGERDDSGPRLRVR